MFSVWGRLCQQRNMKVFYSKRKLFFLNFLKFAGWDCYLFCSVSYTFVYQWRHWTEMTTTANKSTRFWFFITKTTFYIEHWNNTADEWSQSQGLKQVTEQHTQQRHTCTQCTTTMSHNTGHWLVNGQRWTGEQTYSGLSAGRWQQTNTVAFLLRNKPVILQNTNTDSDRLLQVYRTSYGLGFLRVGVFDLTRPDLWNHFIQRFRWVSDAVMIVDCCLLDKKTCWPVWTLNLPVPMIPKTSVHSCTGWYRSTEITFKST